MSQWKGSQRIMAIPDANIHVIDVRPTTGKMTFTIDGITVTWPHGKTLAYSCGKVGHRLGNCPHVKRIAKYIKDNYE